MMDGAPHTTTLRADPLADATIARILGPWDDGASHSAQWAAIGLVNRLLAEWQSNGALAGWQAGGDVPAHVAAALQDYVRTAQALPPWADPARIARAETLFMDMSMISCTLLFCASLPECYVCPDLAGVLHAAGQLEQHTDYRIRSTAAMIFPVMMQGGLTAPDGGGVAQVLKVRLIHATIRHLILRGDPALAAGSPSVLPPLAPEGDSLHQTLYARGWDVTRAGLPCNQEELAYTLLTFSYVYLRGLRKLGIGLCSADEQAYLHTWNVMGHVLGIERDLMCDTFAEAEARFARMQQRARAMPYLPDPRPALGAALMTTISRELPLRVLKPFPVLLTRHLCGPHTTRDLGLTQHVSWLSRTLFAAAMGGARLIDRLGRLFHPEFSISRLITRVVGYRLTVRLLMDETRPLKLPAALLDQVNAVTRTWRHDVRAPRWMNRLEARLTGHKPPSPASEPSP